MLSGHITGFAYKWREGDSHIIGGGSFAYNWRGGDFAYIGEGLASHINGEGEASHINGERAGFAYKWGGRASLNSGEGEGVRMGVACEREERGALNL